MDAEQNDEDYQGTERGRAVRVAHYSCSDWCTEVLDISNFKQNKLPKVVLNMTGKCFHVGPLNKSSGCSSPPCREDNLSVCLFVCLSVCLSVQAVMMSTVMMTT